MSIEKIPDGLGGVQIVAGSSDQERRQVLRTAGPGVASALDDVYHDVRASLAAGVDLVPHAGPVMRLLQKVLNRRLGGSPVPLAPKFGRLGEGDCYSAITQHRAAANMHQRIFAAVDKHHGDRRGWLADGHQGLGHGGGHGGNGGQFVGQVTGQSVGKEASVRNSGGVGSLGIGVVSALQFGDQGTDESDVIRRGQPPGVVPALVETLR